jgi:hypothetical protein
MHFYIVCSWQICYNNNVTQAQNGKDNLSIKFIDKKLFNIKRILWSPFLIAVYYLNI